MSMQPLAALAKLQLSSSVQPAGSGSWPEMLASMRKSLPQAFLIS